MDYACLFSLKKLRPLPVLLVDGDENCGDNYYCKKWSCLTASDGRDILFLAVFASVLILCAAGENGPLDIVFTKLEYLCVIARLVGGWNRELDVADDVVAIKLFEELFDFMNFYNKQLKIWKYLSCM